LLLTLKNTTASSLKCRKIGEDGVNIQQYVFKIWGIYTFFKATMIWYQVCTYRYEVI